MKKKVKETSAKYEGIVRWIREQIEAEELQPGERIESEYQLCDRFWGKSIRPSDMRSLFWKKKV